MLKNKNGIALNQAFGAVLTLVLVAVLVIVAIVIFASINTSFAGTTSASVTNESITPTDTGVAVSGAANCSSADFVAVSVNNFTTVINSPNYTFSGTTGVLTNLTSEFTTNSWNITYTYTWGSEACTAGNDMITQFATYPVLVGLVGTIIFLGIVIGVLVASFVFGGRRGV